MFALSREMSDELDAAAPADRVVSAMRGWLTSSHAATRARAVSCAACCISWPCPAAGRCLPVTRAALWRHRRIGPGLALRYDLQDMHGFVTNETLMESALSRGQVIKASLGTPVQPLCG